MVRHNMKMRPAPRDQYGPDMVHQLTRIADSMTPDGTMEVTREAARAAWEKAGMRIYDDRFLEALDNLGVQVV